MSEGQLLEIEGLSIRLKSQSEERTLVDDISFSVSKSETLGIVGESGSGKSISSLAILRLLHPHLIQTARKMNFYSKESGSWLELQNLSVQSIRKLRGKEIGMIFQEPMTALNPSYTCGDQLIEVIKLHLGLGGEKARQHAYSWLDRVKIHDQRKAFTAYPHQLSGGQRQRVMIAMAMCCNPSLLIADEPTTALDVTVQKSVLELMTDLQHEFKTGIIFITHDLGVIGEVSDKLMVMNQGKVVERGSTKEVLSAPSHPYTRGLIACRPPLQGKLKRLPVMKDFFTSNNDKGKSASEIKNLLNQLKPEEEKSVPNSENLIQPLLEVDNIEAKYPSEDNFFGKPTSYFTAVNNVSFKLNPGETLGLVGESGCGKTSLGRSVLNLVKHTEGVVKYKGRSIDFKNHKELHEFRRKIQLVFQDPYSSLNPSQTVGNAIMEPLRVHFKEIMTMGEMRIKTLDLLDKVGLSSNSFNRYPHEFSGGQRQRIGIARAISLNPEILICDESVSALDMSVQAQVLNLLNELKKEFGLTYLFISHDLSVVRYMSDRLIVMKDGKIEEEGQSEAIYTNPESEYTKKLIASIPTFEIS